MPIAPFAHHRARFRQGKGKANNEQLLKLSNAFALAGMFFLAPAMAAAMYVVTHSRCAPAVAMALAAAVGAGIVALWFAAPALYRTDGVTRFPPSGPRG